MEKRREERRKEEGCEEEEVEEVCTSFPVSICLPNYRLCFGNGSLRKISVILFKLARYSCVAMV